MTEGAREGAFVELDRISVRYPKSEVPAVDGLTIEAARGEIVTLLGPSGCGKTTALRVIAGLEKPQHGRVRVAGRDVTDLAPERRNMGFVFQNYALFPHLDVAENIAFGLRVRGVSRENRRRAIAEALDLVQLDGYESRRVDQLSGGQQQRVALARALAIKPEVLLLDEPLSNLDASLREQTRESLRALLGKLGVTTFFVTHDQAEAMAFSDRIVLMRKGRMVETGDPVSLYRRPRSLFAAEFLGAANILRGQSSAAECVVLLEPVDAQITLTAESWSPGARNGEPSRVAVVARPEHLKAVDGPGTNRLPARVVDHLYLGNCFRVTALVDGLSATVTILSMDPISSERIYIEFPPASLHVIGPEAVTQ